MPTLVPGKIGKYDVVGLIGHGGMGIVYEAVDSQLGRRVAIKTITGIFAENPDMLKRFNREAQSLANLQHPNIVTLYDLGNHEGNPYLVMEYLEGENLDAALSNRRRLTLLNRIGIIVQVCQGLSYVHRRGVIHRDIKPANIMLCKDGGVKIFDFGIAHSGDRNVTRTGELIGTLKYMAPEQVNSNLATCRSDIYSTGVVLYQLLTDHLPFEGDNTATTILKIVHEPPPPLSTFLTTYPPEIEQILVRAMAKNPKDRYDSADEFALDLQDLLARLKEELISREMQQVTTMLDRGEVYEAQGSLLRVLTIEKQHSGAIRLLREVQQRIQRHEIGKQVLSLRELAEKAMADGQFGQAQEHVDQALTLDLDDPGLKQLRDTIRAEASRAERLQKALNLAQAEQAEGNLDDAKKAAEEALALAPDDTQARTLHGVISRQIEERGRRQQIEGWLREGRHEIASRKYAAALEILKKAELLDPADPEVHSLIASAVAGLEDERRRAELEASIRDIEKALNSDDFRGACEKSDEALARFPGERNLVGLKALAEKQRQIREHKQFVDEQLAMARQLLQAGRTEEFKEKLQTVILPAVQSPPPTRVPSSGVGPSQSPSEFAGDGLDEAKLLIIERQLAAFIGPLAKVLVKRAAAKTGSTAELYGILAADLEREDDRKVFLAQASKSDSGRVSAHSSGEVPKEAVPPPGTPPAAAAVDDLTPAAINQAARLLTAHLGPIAAVLVKKEARRATTLRNLHELLAQHVEPAERERFLKKCASG